MRLAYRVDFGNVRQDDEIGRVLREVAAVCVEPAEERAVPVESRGGCAEAQVHQHRPAHKGVLGFRLGAGQAAPVEGVLQQLVAEHILATVHVKDGALRCCRSRGATRDIQK